MKQLYRTGMYNEIYYCWANTPAGAIRYFRRQALRKFGKYSLTELYVRERAYKWNKIQLTTKLLQSCGMQ